MISNIKIKSFFSETFLSSDIQCPINDKSITEIVEIANFGFKVPESMQLYDAVKLSYCRDSAWLDRITIKKKDLFL